MKKVFEDKRNVHREVAADAYMPVLNESHLTPNTCYTTLQK